MKIPVLTLIAGLLAGFLVGILLVGPKKKDEDMRQAASIQRLLVLSAQLELGNKEAARQNLSGLSEICLKKIDDENTKSALSRSLAGYYLATNQVIPDTLSPLISKVTEEQAKRESSRFLIAPK
jgi:hypothetical protein